MVASTPCFELLALDGAARRGRLRTRRGVVETPVFMPVATRGSLKSLGMEELEKLGFSIILSNTYHLHLRPGEELIQKMGGLQNWISWPRSILTDSGGFQVFSLSRLRKISADGVTFNSHIDGRKTVLTPEKSLEIQWRLGSDILMAFDVCPPIPSSPEELERAVALTSRWARKSRDHLYHLGMEGRLFFPIVQGGLEVEQRRRSLGELLPLGAEGIAIGGLSVGEGREERNRILEKLVPEIPLHLPRYLMGVGTPEDLFDGVERGIDMFDCVQPTRVARHGTLYTHHGKVLIRNKCFTDDSQPIDPLCRCRICQRYSRSYIRHLFAVGEATGGAFASEHNLFFFKTIMDGISEAIAAGRFDDYKNRFISRYLAGVAGEINVVRLD